jgi:hypothetical protein
MAAAASCVAVNFFSAPPNVPNAVRFAETTKMPDLQAAGASARYGE